MKKGVLFLILQGTVVNTEDLIALKVGHIDSRFRRLWKGKNIFFNHITKKMGSFIHYTSLLPMCNYRTKAFDQRSIRELRAPLEF
jgi:hypothetical protein